MRPLIVMCFVRLLLAGGSDVLAPPQAFARAEPVPGVARPTSTVIEEAGWAIAAPSDWSRFARVRPPMVLYLIGDARQGIPPMDGTLSAIKAGLTVDVLPARAELSARDRAKQDVEALRRIGFVINGMAEVEDIALADGTKAVRLVVEVFKTREGRLSFYEKVYCTLPDGRHVVATSFLACGKGGGPFVKKAGLVAFAGAHAESLVLDAKKLDQKRLDAAYDSLNLHVGDAIPKTRAGNRLLEKEAYEKAATEFREALKLCDFFPAAHNGLAWALLQPQPTTKEAQAEAMIHAEAAVKLTDRRDPAALDTLALAHSRAGDKAKAIATIHEALKLDPRNADLQRSLEKYEKGP